MNTGSPIYIKVEKHTAKSTVSKILDMVEHAQSKKAKSEKFISVFAKYYTPIVVALAVTVMFVPPLFLGDFRTWIYRGLMFLVVSCPCALVVSIPHLVSLPVSVVRQRTVFLLRAVTSSKSLINLILSYLTKQVLLQKVYLP